MWIDDFRSQHGMDVDEFARRVRMLGIRKMREKRGRSFPVGCSSMLIYRLETAAKPRTHPNIADLIAEACGATAEQRDSIMDPVHRGTWTGDGVPMALVIGARLPEFAPKIKKEADQFRPGKEVVKIARDGHVIGRYKSLIHAATECRQSMDMVERRVRREIKNEFEKTGFSFRYARDWDGKSEIWRKTELERVKKEARRRGR